MDNKHQLNISFLFGFGTGRANTNGSNLYFVKKVSKCVADGNSGTSIRQIIIDPRRAFLEREESVPRQSLVSPLEEN